MRSSVILFIMTKRDLPPHRHLLVIGFSFLLYYRGEAQGSCVPRFLPMDFISEQAVEDPTQNDNCRPIAIWFRNEKAQKENGKISHFIQNKELYTCSFIIAMICFLPSFLHCVEFPGSFLYPSRCNHMETVWNWLLTLFFKHLKYYTSTLHISKIESYKMLKHLSNFELFIIYFPRILKIKNEQHGNADFSSNF